MLNEREKLTHIRLINKVKLMNCMLLFMLLIMVGMFFNFQAIKDGKGKMPVLSDYRFETDEHYGYIHKDEVPNWILTDFIETKNYIWSIGDFMMIISLDFFAAFAIVLIIFDTQYRMKIHHISHKRRRNKIKLFNK
jgi:hypothetical protein